MNSKTAYTISSSSSITRKKSDTSSNSLNYELCRRIFKARDKLLPIVDDLLKTPMGQVDHQLVSRHYLSMQQFEHMVSSAQVIREAHNVCFRTGSSKTNSKSYFTAERRHVNINFNNEVYVDTSMLLEVIELNKMLEDVMSKMVEDEKYSSGNNSQESLKLLTNAQKNAPPPSSENSIVVKLSEQFFGEHLQPDNINDTSVYRPNKFIVMSSQNGKTKKTRSSALLSAVSEERTSAVSSNRSSNKDIIRDAHGAASVIVKCMSDLERVRSYLDVEKIDAGIMPEPFEPPDKDGKVAKRDPSKESSQGKRVSISDDLVIPKSKSDVTLTESENVTDDTDKTLTESENLAGDSDKSEEKSKDESVKKRKSSGSFKTVGSKKTGSKIDSTKGDDVDDQGSKCSCGICPAKDGIPVDDDASQIVICIKGHNDEDNVQIIIKQCPECVTTTDKGKVREKQPPSDDAKPIKGARKELEQAPVVEKPSEQKMEKAVEAKPRETEFREKSVSTIDRSDVESIILHNKISTDSIVCSTSSEELRVPHDNFFTSSEEKFLDTSNIHVVYNVHDPGKSVVRSKNKSPIVPGRRSNSLFPTSYSRMKLDETVNLCLQTAGGEELLVSLRIRPKPSWANISLGDIFSGSAADHVRKESIEDLFTEPPKEGTLDETEEVITSRGVGGVYTAPPVVLKQKSIEVDEVVKPESEKLVFTEPPKKLSKSSYKHVQMTTSDISKGNEVEETLAQPESLEKVYAAPPPAHVDSIEIEVHSPNSPLGTSNRSSLSKATGQRVSSQTTSATQTSSFKYSGPIFLGEEVVQTPKSSIVSRERSIQEGFSSMREEASTQAEMITKPPSTMEETRLQSRTDSIISSKTRSPQLRDKSTESTRLSGEKIESFIKQSSADRVLAVPPKAPSPQFIDRGTESQLPSITSKQQESFMKHASVQKVLAEPPAAPGSNQRAYSPSPSGFEEEVIVKQESYAEVFAEPKRSRSQVISKDESIKSEIIREESMLEKRSAEVAYAKPPSQEASTEMDVPMIGTEETFEESLKAISRESSIKSSPQMTSRRILKEESFLKESSVKDVFAEPPRIASRVEEPPSVTSEVIDDSHKSDIGTPEIKEESLIELKDVGEVFAPPAVVRSKSESLVDSHELVVKISSTREDGMKEDRVIPLSRTKICSSLEFDVTVVDTKLRTQGVQNENPRIIIRLNDLGVDNLLRACRPAKCCRKAILNEKMKKCLPYSASLRSLPLDDSDVEIIQQSVQMNVQKVKKSTDIHRDLNKMAYYISLHNATPYEKFINLKENTKHIGYIETHCNLTNYYNRKLYYYINLVNGLDEEFPKLEYEIRYFEVINNNQTEKPVAVTRNIPYSNHPNSNNNNSQGLGYSQIHGSKNYSERIKQFYTLGTDGELRPKSKSKIPVYKTNNSKMRKREQRSESYKGFAKKDDDVYGVSLQSLPRDMEDSKNKQIKDKNNVDIIVNKKFTDSDAKSIFNSLQEIAGDMSSCKDIRVLSKKSDDIVSCCDSFERSFNVFCKTREASQQSISCITNKMYTAGAVKTKKKKSEFYMSRSRSELSVKATKTSLVCKNIYGKRKLSSVFQGNAHSGDAQENKKDPYNCSELIIEIFAKILFDMILKQLQANGKTISGLLGTSNNIVTKDIGLITEQDLSQATSTLDEKYSSSRITLSKKQHMQLNQNEKITTPKLSKGLQTFVREIDVDKYCQVTDIDFLPEIRLKQYCKKTRIYPKLIKDPYLLTDATDSCDQFENFIVVFKSDRALKETNSVEDVTFNVQSCTSSLTSMINRSLSGSIIKFNTDELGDNPYHLHEMPISSSFINPIEYMVYENSKCQSLLQNVRSIFMSTGSHDVCKKCGCYDMATCPPRKNFAPSPCCCPADKKSRPTCACPVEKKRPPPAKKKKPRSGRSKPFLCGSLISMKKSLTSLFKSNKGTTAELCGCSKVKKDTATICIPPHVKVKTCSALTQTCQCDKCENFDADGNCRCSHCLGIRDKSVDTGPETKNFGVLCKCFNISPSDKLMGSPDQNKSLSNTIPGAGGHESTVKFNQSKDNTFLDATSGADSMKSATTGDPTFRTANEGHDTTASFQSATDGPLATSSFEDALDETRGSTAFPVAVPPPDMFKDFQALESNKANCYGEGCWAVSRITVCTDAKDVRVFENESSVKINVLEDLANVFLCQKKC